MKTLQMPELSDEKDSDLFYNAGDKTFVGLRDVMGAVEGIDEILRTYHNLEIGMYETGSTDYLFTVLPYQEETTTLYHVRMMYEYKGQTQIVNQDVQADDMLSAISIAGRVEQKGKLIEAKAEAFEVPVSRVKEYIREQ